MFHAISALLSSKTERNEAEVKLAIFGLGTGCPLACPWEVVSDGYCHTSFVSSFFFPFSLYRILFTLIREFSCFYSSFLFPRSTCMGSRGVSGCVVLSSLLGLSHSTLCANWARLVRSALKESLSPFPHLRDNQRALMW